MAEYNYQGLANEVVSRGISLAESFEDWTKLAFALSYLGEDGRQMFHAISSLSTKYRQAENDRKFTNAMNTASKVGISTFIYMCQHAGIDTHKYYQSKNKVFAPVKISEPQQQETPSYISKEIVERTQSPKNNLIKYLCGTGLFDFEQIQMMCALYFIGSTKDGSIIYFQIDESMRVHGGKVIAYNTETGHRIKENGVSWVHSKLNLPNFHLRQCLFGEHLLKLYPDKPICLVEAEKTALVASMMYPQYNWLSCGGFGNFKSDMLQALKGREVVVFPDTDTTGVTFAKWKQAAKEMNFVVSDFVERNANDAQKERKCDIADLILEETEPTADFSPEAKALQNIIERSPAVGNLVEKLGLKIVA